MAMAPVLPHAAAGQATKAEVEAAGEAFLRSGFDVRKEGGLWRVKKLLRSGDRYLNDDELVLLARSLR